MTLEIAENPFFTITILGTSYVPAYIQVNISLRAAKDFCGLLTCILQNMKTITTLYPVDHITDYNRYFPRSSPTHFIFFYIFFRHWGKRIKTFFMFKN